MLILYQEYPEWCCLTNYPIKIEEAEKKIEKNTFTFNDWLIWYTFYLFL